MPKTGLATAAKTARVNSKKTAAVPAAAPTQREEPALRLGVQLKHARLVKQMRLRDVAEQSGYSESLISKFENNKATPSLNTLHRIGKVLGTSVAALLNEHSTDGNVVFRPHQRPVIQEIEIGGVGSDGTEAEVMIPLGASGMLQAFVIRVQPGGSSDGTRTHEGEEVGYVHRGELLLTVSGQTYHLQEGDSFFFPSTVPHEFRNPGSTITEVIWVNTPPSL